MNLKNILLFLNMSALDNQKPYKKLLQGICAAAWPENIDKMVNSLNQQVRTYQLNFTKKDAFRFVGKAIIKKGGGDDDYFHPKYNTHC